MRTLPELFENNRQWASDMRQSDPAFFEKLAQQQSPGLLWIGCSDSRVPANTIVGLLPGELFVHRNVGNLVISSDMNCLSVIHFAVEMLKVRHIIVCGHYGCGGVKTAVEGCSHGLIDNWLRPIQDLHREKAGDLSALDGEERMDRLCELNVIEQVRNVAKTNVVQEAWGRGQSLVVHGWIYSIANGLLKDLGVSLSSRELQP